MNVSGKLLNVRVSHGNSKCSNLERNMVTLRTPFEAAIPTSGDSLVELSPLTCEMCTNSGTLVQNKLNFQTPSWC